MYELLIANKTSGKMWNVSNAVTEVSYETHRSGSPAKLSFTVLKSGDLSFVEGDIVRFSCDGNLEFYGWVFTKVKDRWGVIQVTCYDRMRYLKANATYAFYAQKASDIVRQIAEDLQIDVGSLDDTGYAIPSFIKSNQSCIDIIQDALNQTLLNTGIIYTLYDNGSGLSLKAASNWISDYVIGDRSYMTDYSYKTDIDSNMYNSIKLVQPNDETGKNDVVVAQDSSSIARYGLLQLYQSVNNLNTAQMTAQAQQSLKYYNRRRRVLTFSSLGIPGIRAGMMMRLIVSGLGDINLNQLVLLETVTHKWTNKDHTMDIETLEF